MPGWFVAGAAALGAIGSVASASIGGDAATSAANTQANAANNATALDQSMFNTTQSNFSPYLQAGNNSLATLMQQLGLSGPGATGTPGAGSPLALPTYGSTINGVANPTYAPPSATAYQQSPDYQFLMQQGTSAINNQASAGGGIQSGNTLKALTQYGQGLASTDYQQFLNNYLTGYQANTANYANAYNSAGNNANTNFNRLQTLAGSGQNAAGSLGALGSQTAGQIGNNITGAGNALAAGTVGSASAMASGINGVVSSATGAANGLSQLSFLSQLMNGSNTGTGGAGGSVGSFDPSSLYGNTSPLYNPLAPTQ